MNVIVAVNSDWGIGYNSTQTIVFPEDRQHFKKITDGGVVIAGRVTFEDFGRPLPNRKNIVLSRDRSYGADGVTVAHSIEEVLAMVSGCSADKVFVIGGGSVYDQFLPQCTHAYITKIHKAPPSDTFFPNLDELPDWSLITRGETQESGGINYSFNLYRRTTDV